MVLLLIRIFFLVNITFQDLPSCYTLIKTSGSDAFTDILGNWYVLNNQKTEITKYNSKGVFINRYSNLSLGKIHSVDVSNPLRILLFYRQRQALVFLDNQLSQNGVPVYLEKLNLQAVSMACSSSLSNGFWLFDESNYELFRFNSDNVLQIRSGNLKIFLRKDFHPDEMVESNSQLYVRDTLNGIFVFDQFGTHTSSIPLKIKKFFFVNNELLTYLDNNVLHRYHLKWKTFDQETLSPANVRKMYFTKNHRALVFSDSIIICKP